MKQLIRLICLLALLQVLPVAEAQGVNPAVPALGAEQLASLDAVVQEEISAGRIGGAVILIGNREGSIYRKAFGNRAKDVPMTADTIFDLASLTKVVATTTAVMQLVERGKLKLDAPVTRYWREFGRKGKSGITIRQLLTHYSGLRPDLDLQGRWHGYDKAMSLIAAEQPTAAPGTSYSYSDINFAILGELVRRVSGEPLDVYCATHVFQPALMKDTSFAPSDLARVAPTEYFGGTLRHAVVHDPTAYRMGGIAGHAGLFSTADDLAAFARLLLDSSNAKPILRQNTVTEMSQPQSPAGAQRLRGLGWDLAAPLALNRDALPPVGSYGHTGYTGTMLWIDPISQMYVIVLTNRVYPNGKGDVGPLRKAVLQTVSNALGPRTDTQVIAQCPTLAAFYASSRKYGNGPRVETGIDVLEAEHFTMLQGLRLGLITNHTGLDAAGNRTVDLLHRAPGVRLAAIFSPEHGLYGNRDEKVESGTEPVTGLPVFSLYGSVKRPTDAMLQGLDALVFDMQDAGVRFYTYATTMAYAMEAAARHNLDFYVLDRPNPISADIVQGPVMDPDLKSFTGNFPLPIRHGMTIGELAELFNTQGGIGAKLHVIKMRGYQRNVWFDQTGLTWVNPSPNLRTVKQAALYPGVGLLEGANVSVGRGTETPFEQLGAPWIDGKALADYLNRRQIAGVHFAPAHFTPRENRYKEQRCEGIRVILTNRQQLDTSLLGIEIASALQRLHPDKFQLQKILGMVGARSVVQAITEGQDPRVVVAGWQGSLEEFIRLRAGHLLY
ncbi:MAG TPA: exo-beta-N-acetylmuramidase NamZ domain-containing protein [Gallionella sp.]|nr:exo-beta-N-acetylmuramidase NamZ domain-containing protein [Gallionella sp.]